MFCAIGGLLPIRRLLFLVPVMLLSAGCAPERATPSPELASREYKLLLDPARFEKSVMRDSLAELDKLAAAAAHRSGVAYEGSLLKPVRTREVVFLDVPGKCTLRKNDLVLRLRSRGTKTTATLKYRTGKTGLTNNRSPWAGIESALEADITPPHETVYSRSLSAKRGNNRLQNLGDLYTLFPVTRSLREAPETKLAIVGKTPVREEVRGKVQLDLGSKSSMSLSLWYNAGNDTEPVIAELSFKYATGRNAVSDEQHARTLFVALQQLEGWISPLSMTKTAFLYASSPGFCEQP